VVAFENMESREQLQIFMDINENQKAVSKNLRLDLEEDINWESLQVDSRLKALRSSIIKALAADSGSVLANKISVGEDSSDLNSRLLTMGFCNPRYCHAPANNLIQRTRMSVCMTLRILITIRQ
jgi:DNA sulfur modification protein DndB